MNSSKCEILQSELMEHCSSLFGHIIVNIAETFTGLFLLLLSLFVNTIEGLFGPRLQNARRYALRISLAPNEVFILHEERLKIRRQRLVLIEQGDIDPLLVNCLGLEEASLSPISHFYLVVAEINHDLVTLDRKRHFSKG